MTNYVDSRPVTRTASVEDVLNRWGGSDSQVAQMVVAEVRGALAAEHTASVVEDAEQAIQAATEVLATTHCVPDVKTEAEIKVEALREAARAARAAWSPHACPWVGFLDDRAAAIESGAAV